MSVGIFQVMSELPPECDALLSPAGHQIIANIPDLDLRSRISEALAHCFRALVALDRIELSRFELLDADLSDLSVWEEAAPQAGAMMAAVNAALSGVTRLFPEAPAEVAEQEDDPLDVDSAFDMMEEGGGDEAAPSRPGEKMDQLVSGASGQDPAAIARALTALLQMLRHDFLSLGRKLRDPAVVGYRWSLLGELQEFQSRATQGFEAIAAALLAPFGANPTELMPRYITEVNRSMILRGSLVNLDYDINAFNAHIQLTQDLETARALWERLLVYMDSFAASAPYRFLWPRDKKEIITFRVFLLCWEREGADLPRFKEHVEGFAKFCDTLRQINKRPELELHDKRHLSAARELLEFGMGEESAYELLQQVYGRDDTLDTWLRWRWGLCAPPEAPLPAIIDHALSLL